MEGTRRSARFQSVPNGNGRFLETKKSIHAVMEYLEIQDVLKLESVNKDLRRIVCSSESSEVWSHFIWKYFCISNECGNKAAFSALAKTRIWNWDRVFSQRVFWARVGYSLSSYFEDNLVFGCSFSSAGKDLSKLNQDFEHWDDGHRIVFPMPSDYYLSYEVNDHTMSTWRVGRGPISDKCWHEVDRIDGHPIGPGFTYEEAHQIIEYIAEHCSLTFDSSFLWPMFVFAVALPGSMRMHMTELMSSLRASGWRLLRLSKKNWQLMEEYFRDRITYNEAKSHHKTARHWNDEADACFNGMMAAIRDSYNHQNSL